MPRPKRPRSDANQLDILNGLRQCGLAYVVVSSLASKTIYGKPPLDVFVLGYDPKEKRAKWIQVEIKADVNSTFTDSEVEWIEEVERDYGEGLAIIATCLDDILYAFNRI